MTKLNVVVLAAGKGTRMFSDTPKVLHVLAGKTLLQHVVDSAATLGSSLTCVVVGHEADRLRQALDGQNICTVVQEPQLGTGHAVQQALNSLDKDAVALILYGDVPLVKVASLQKLLHQIDGNSMAVLTCTMSNPAGLGRIVRNNNGGIQRIVEDKDATQDLLNIKEINTGIMAIPVARLHAWLPQLENNNSQNEFYLTDIVALALKDGCKVHTTIIEDELEAAGVNTRKQLAELERYYQKREADRLMLAGLMLRDPARFDVRGELLAGRDVEIDVNVIIVGKVQLGDRVRIGPNCILRDCDIGEGSVIHSNSIIGEATVGARCDIGPFARIRPGTVLEEQAKIGNFVEVKKSRIGKNSKVSHLSYIGDSTLGSEVNIGAGTITCNYDGANKFTTTIGNDVFIGSNSALVAPVNIADGATIAAGSVITENVGSKQLALARSKQINKDGWKRRPKKSG